MRFYIKVSDMVNIFWKYVLCIGVYTITIITAKVK